MRVTLSSLVLALLFGAPAAVKADLINGGFENGFSGWSATDHAYLVTIDGVQRQRHSYQDYLGWEGADVWFNAANAGDGASYAVFGSNGNESDGSVQSGLWSATNRFVSFLHAGNNTSFLPEYSRAFAAILDVQGNELLRVYATSFNDSQWRSFSLDLSAAGLHYGDQFMFYYEDGYSWSVLDAVAQSGDVLPSPAQPVNAPFGLSALALFGMWCRGSSRKAA